MEIARPLRAMLASACVRELHFLGESTFPNHVTYPLVSTVSLGGSTPTTRIVHRDGTRSVASLTMSTSWLPVVQGFAPPSGQPTLANAALRISCGVATGADTVFVVPTASVSPALRRFAHPTISGRQILPSGELQLESSLLAAYAADGRLLPESRLGALGAYLTEPDRRRQLLQRTCAARKPWYAFHDNLPLPDMRRPKLLCKDITERAFFVADAEGVLVPRHSVYYVVPNRASDLLPLLRYLNSPTAGAWLQAHCQRAAGGFLRLQRHVLKPLPLPESLLRELVGVTERDPELELVPA